MDEYPDPDDEYDLIHQDEMELLREVEAANPIPKSAPSRQHLNFDSHKVESHRIDVDEDNDDVENDGNLVIDLPFEGCQIRKRQLSADSLTGVEELRTDVEQPPVKRHKSHEMPNDNFDFNGHCGVTSRRFPQWPFLTFNTYNGERYYVKFREDDDTYDINKFFTNKLNKSRLLSESFQNLKALAEKSLNECLERSRANEEDQDVVLCEESSDLWVEEYKPKGYLELLSDEGVNRSLLNWLKKWDKIVFNKPDKKTPPKPNVDQESNRKFRNNSNTNNNYNNKLNNEINSLDADGRPHYKIALLCGPPGLGKTTLAHVIATLAGYNVIEVNASDDRSTEAFHSKLVEATQNQNVFGSRKPNCIVLDEIDGAPAATVEYFLKCVNGKTSQKGGKKEKGKPIVKKPVICICNEPYVPSLRQLRQQAYVVHFPQTSSSRLAQRLLEICKKQNIKTDLSTLTLLCEKMQSDIRCCISTLYFFKHRKGQTFRPSDVAKCNVGQKDLQKGLFSMWQEIFQVPMRKHKFLFNNSEKSNDVVSSHFHYSHKNMERLRYLVQLFQSSGEFERLQEGIYENFLKMKFPQTLTAMTSGLDWFCWTDILDTNIKEHQNYTLLPYLPYSFPAWHFLFSSPGYAKIAFPKARYENHMKQVRTEQIIRDVLRGLNPSIRSNTDGYQLILDVLPMFKTILVPHLRPVNFKLFSDREKKDFEHLLNVMIDYNLNYIQQRSPDGTYHFQFDPNIEEITEFSEMERNKLAFSYNMKQFISREVEMERVRRMGSADGGEIMQKKVAEEVPKSGAKAPFQPPKLNLKKTNIGKNDGEYKDFFGRIVKVKPSEKKKGSVDEDECKSKVWFKFNEGFNNAVKKDITINYLL